MLAGIADGWDVEVLECVESKMPPRVSVRAAVGTVEPFTKLRPAAGGAGWPLGWRGSGRTAWTGCTQFRWENFFRLQMTFPVGAGYSPSQSPRFLPQGSAQCLVDHLTRGTQIPGGLCLEKWLAQMADGLAKRECGTVARDWAPALEKPRFGCASVAF